MVSGGGSIGERYKGIASVVKRGCFPKKGRIIRGNWGGVRSREKKKGLGNIAPQGGPTPFIKSIKKEEGKKILIKNNPNPRKRRNREERSGETVFFAGRARWKRKKSWSRGKVFAPGALRGKALFEREEHLSIF